MAMEIGWSIARFYAPAGGHASFAHLTVQGRQLGAGQINVEDDVALSSKAQDMYLKGFALKSDLASATASLRAHLKKARIDIPLSGRRLAPKLNLAKVDIRPLIQPAGSPPSPPRSGGS
jgi:hypothetical protein